MVFEDKKLRFEIPIEDSAYPPLLKEAPEAPERIYGIGNAEALRPGLAVIGARKATPYGLTCANYFTAYAARKGLTIISGGALGCDQAAHKAALKEGSTTVVVFGSGADVVYPKRSRKLFENVVEAGGAIISEQPWGMPPLPHQFRARNRIIAGLAMLLLIAEAGMPSGTFSTADAALAAGREVAAVPGSILSSYSKGANKLICQGATPVVDFESFEDALQMAFERFPLSMLPEVYQDNKIARLQKKIKEDEILEALASESYSADELAVYFGFSPAELLSRLSQYEMQGLVERNRDGKYFLTLQ